MAPAIIFRGKKNARDRTVHRTCTARVVFGEFTTRVVVWCVILVVVKSVRHKSEVLTRLSVRDLVLEESGLTPEVKCEEIEVSKREDKHKCIN
jgi:hypothetical protein